MATPNAANALVDKIKPLFQRRPALDNSSQSFRAGVRWAVCFYLGLHLPLLSLVLCGGQHRYSEITMIMKIKTRRWSRVPKYAHLFDLFIDHMIFSSNLFGHVDSSINGKVVDIRMYRHLPLFFRELGGTRMVEPHKYTPQPSARSLTFLSSPSPSQAASSSTDPSSKDGRFDGVACCALQLCPSCDHPSARVVASCGPY